MNIINSIIPFERSHSLFKENKEDKEKEVLTLLRGLSHEAQRNLLEMVRNGPPEADT